MTEFNNVINQVCTDMFTGEHYHEQCANQFRKVGLRGFGRWCDCESRGDYESRVCLEKLLCDRLDYFPKINTSGINSALSYQISGAKDLKAALEAWYNMETDCIATLNKAVELARTVDICVYNKLCCMLDEVQNEKSRVKMMNKRLELKNYDGHDVAQVSKELHKYFEENPDSRDLDFNVG